MDAVASQRRAAEAVLRDYATISAVELARVARGELDDVLDEILDPVVRRARMRPDLRPVFVGRDLDEAARDQDCACPALRSPHFFFRRDPSGITIEPDTLPASVAGRLDSLLPTGRPGAGRVRNGFVVAGGGELLDEPTLVAYVDSDDDEGHPEPTFGFVASAEALRQLFQTWYDDQQLLPQPIAGSEPNDSLLYVSVDAPGGTQLFASPTPYPTDLGASWPLGARFGDLSVTSSIRPDAAGQLIIGGLPTQRLPLLVLLLGLTVALGAATLFQYRREQSFQRLREDFVSGVSHELRTPLAQIRMFAELQEAGKLSSSKDRERAISIVAREARRLSHLVDNILQFSSLRRLPDQAMPKEALDLGALVTERADALTSILRDRGMALVIDAEPDVVAVANREAVARIVANLLDNAAKYGPNGQTVRVQVDRKGDRVFVAVSDEGPGIPKADRERVWKPYRRLARDVEARIPGSGIGLAVVRDLVALNGGTVRIEDSESGGARFVVELPGHVAGDPDEEEPARPVARSRRSDTVPIGRT